jgi:hypothetical protein
LHFFFALPPKDNPDKRRGHWQSDEGPFTGVVNDEDDTKFYVLLLIPNVARIAVRMWEETTVKDLASNIRQYFEDLDIIRGKADKSYYSLYEILRRILQFSMTSKTFRLCSSMAWCCRHQWLVAASMCQSSAWDVLKQTKR